MSGLTHIDAAGAARMVDVSAKAATKRTAVAEGRITMAAVALDAIRAGAIAKGDVLAVARIAGIMAAKRTADLIPLCHPLPIAACTVDLVVEADGVRATATVTTSGQTGVEMEALTAVSVALLTIYDMAKALDRGMTIGATRLLAKSGGRSGDWARGMSLLPVAEAQARLLALATPLPIEAVTLIEAAGRFPAEDVIARRTQPAVALSSMDGYAIRFAERPGPWRLVGESAAGRPLDRALAPGEAARIFTGAALPGGADTVLLQEDATAGEGQVRETGDGPRAAGTHIRPQGSDFAAGAVLVAAGDAFTPARIALAAMGGHGQVPVRRRARIALLSTGDELVPPGSAGAGLPASNAPMLAALCGGTLATIDDRGIVADDLDALVAAFRAAADADIIVTTGGVSVGDHDLVRPALLAAGAELDFWRVAMRPGKPLMAGRLGGAIVLGLPGNPVSAFVTATLFLKPLLAHLAGSTAPIPPLARAITCAALAANGARADYLRAFRTADGVCRLTRQDSGDLSTLAGADCLIVRAPHAADVPAGAAVDILPLA